jgi:hypothetical protein
MPHIPMKLRRFVRTQLPGYYRVRPGTDAGTWVVGPGDDSQWGPNWDSDSSEDLASEAETIAPSQEALELGEPTNSGGLCVPGDGTIPEPHPLPPGDTEATGGRAQDRQHPTQEALDAGRLWHGPCQTCGVSRCAWVAAGTLVGDMGPAAVPGVPSAGGVCGDCGLDLGWADGMGLLAGWYSPSWVWTMEGRAGDGQACNPGGFPRYAM